MVPIGRGRGARRRPGNRGTGRRAAGGAFGTAALRRSHHHRTVVGFAVALSLAAPVLFGLAPALMSARRAPGTERADTPSPGQTRLRRVLVGVEVALAAALVVAAGLLIKEPRSARASRSRVPGGERRRLQGDPAVGAVRRRRASARRGGGDRAKARGRARFEIVGAASTLALSGTTWTGDATVEGRAADDYERELRHEAVTPAYLRALGARRIEGRLLNGFDREKSPAVAVVNATLAAKYFRAPTRWKADLVLDGRPTSPTG